jgi:regulator of ribonuclease activity A
MMNFTTASLCDTYYGTENFHIAEPLFRSYGSKQAFSGSITTVRCFEDSSVVKKILAEAGEGKVLVVDGGGSHRCALLDAQLATMAFENGWQGIVIYGCIREITLLNQIPIGIRALHAHPLLCHGKDTGDCDVSITFAGVNFRKDHFLYADTDGIIVSDTMLS